MVIKLFIRHGQSRFNAGLTDDFNTSLTPLGLEQANRVAMVLRKEIDATFIGYVSPYARCLQTALQIGLKFTVTSLVGETPEEIHRHLPALIHNDSAKFPDFDWSGFPEFCDYTEETEAKYKERLTAFLEITKDKNVVVVSHRTPIADMLRVICGTHKPYAIGNGSISLAENGKLIYVGACIFYDGVKDGTS